MFEWSTKACALALVVHRRVMAVVFAGMGFVCADEYRVHGPVGVTRVEVFHGRRGDCAERSGERLELDDRDTLFPEILHLDRFAACQFLDRKRRRAHVDLRRVHGEVEEIFLTAGKDVVIVIGRRYRILLLY